MISALNTLPQHQFAIVANEDGDLVVSTSAPLPPLEPDMLLVRTAAIAINPVDVKLTGPMANPGATAGCDFAGTVIATGSRVPIDKFSMGDRIAAVVPGMNSASTHIGAFAEYVTAYAEFAWKIPSDMSFDSAATLGVSATIAGYALFWSLKIPRQPGNSDRRGSFVLVYGGSTASGTMAIQLIRRSGMIPITTCSPHNFPLVQSYGAEKAFDYSTPNCAADIRAYTGNSLYYALDCFCEASSMEICYAAIGRAGGKYTTLEPYPEHLHTRKAIKPEWLLGPRILGKRVGWKPPYDVEPDSDLYKFGKQWFSCFQHMLSTGQIRTHPVRIAERLGISGILEGIELVKKGFLSGEKLVYQVP